MSRNRNFWFEHLITTLVKRLAGRESPSEVSDELSEIWVLVTTNCWLKLDDGWWTISPNVVCWYVNSSPRPGLISPTLKIRLKKLSFEISTNVSTKSISLTGSWAEQVACEGHQQQIWQCEQSKIQQWQSGQMGHLFPCTTSWLTREYRHLERSFEFVRLHRKGGKKLKIWIRIAQI